MNQDYKNALAIDRLSREQVADVLVDLNRRIRGDFFVIEQDDEKIVLGNRACPFAEKVVGRPALCMMTSNVFGSIAAQNLGYSKVVIEEAIALAATLGAGSSSTSNRHPRLRRPTDASTSRGSRARDT